MQTLGIIGFGAFSELMIRHLKSYFKIYIYSHRDLSSRAKELGVTFASLEEVATCDILIIGVLFQYFEETLKKIKSLIKPNTLVLDVASIKVKPGQLMEKYLPKNIEIIATHPLFGPQSAKKGITGLKIVLCPIRTKRLPQIQKFLTNTLKLEVLIKTPKEHDKSMAYVQGLTHFIGRAINNLDIPNTDLNTNAYQNLLKVKKLLGKDSFELFLSIQNANPYAKKVRQSFLNSLNQLEEDVKEK
ncbi:MAG: prephenate dehydrogenase/arogenate dehydrogenase family protein [Candidatus Falkowbacteria bacterium]|nr:prephenate dehydrogenase/arogenate dehydrogenase family protein [Candidatus Falkowbacteria bacterium]